jgi:hypothetical protein
MTLMTGLNIFHRVNKICCTFNRAEQQIEWKSLRVVKNIDGAFMLRATGRRARGLEL